MAERTYLFKLGADDSELKDKTEQAGKRFADLGREAANAPNAAAPRFQLLQTVVGRVGGEVKSLSGAFSGFAQQAVGLGGVGALLGGGLAVGLLAIVENGIKSKAALYDLSRQTGITVESLGALGRVAKISNTDLDTVALASNRLSKALFTQNEDSKGAAQAIQALGINFNSFSKLQPDQQMLQVAKALDQFADGSGKSAAAMLLFGRQGAQLLPFLDDLAKQTDLVGKQTTASAMAAKELEKNLAGIRLAGDDWKRTLINDFIPPLLAFTNQLLDGRKAFGSFTSAFAGIAFDTNPLKDAGGNLQDVRVEIEKTARTLADLKAPKTGLLASLGLAGGTDTNFTKGLEARLDQLNKLKAYLVSQQSRDALGGGGGVLDRFDRPKPQLALKPPDDKTGIGEKANEGHGLIDSIAGEQKQLQLERQRIETGGKIDEVQRFLAVSGQKLADVNSKITATTRAQIVAGLARVVVENDLTQAARIRAAVEDDQAKQAEQARRLNQEAANSIDKYVDAQAAELQNYRDETAAIGQTTEARAKLTAVRKIDQATLEEDRRLGLLAQKAVEDGNVDALVGIQRQRAELQGLADDLREKVIPAVDERYKKERDGYTGINDALQRYTDDASNSAKFAEGVVSGSLDRLTDGVAEFARTGKLHFRDLFVFMGNEFIKQLARMQVAQASAGFGSFIAGALGSLIGGGLTVDSGGAGVNSSNSGYSPARDSAAAYSSKGGIASKQGINIVVNDHVGAQLSASQDADGQITLELIRREADAAAKRGADAGYARVVNDHATGTGRSSQALKARGVALSSGSRRA